MKNTRDPESALRKKDHIELALNSQESSLDKRFIYEPVHGNHLGKLNVELDLASKSMKYPLWISSMTGGTEYAGEINHNLARACAEFGLGMGLGSCRSLLYSDEYLADFDVRSTIGNERPLFGNLGIAQIEELMHSGELGRVEELMEKLRIDGLIIHINPLQEWLQPEGDRISVDPIITLQRFLDALPIPVIVKEVGQGMGYQSLQSLLNLPLEALDFGAHGGTNFSKLELSRSNEEDRNAV